MTIMVYVGSKLGSSVIPVEGIGLDEVQAQRAAIQFARARHRIADPIVLPERVAAVRLRQVAIEANRQPMPTNLNGVSAPFWRRPTCVADCYSGR